MDFFHCPFYRVHFKRRFFGVFKYNRHHAEGRTINKSSGEEEEQEASKEKGEIVHMNEK